jgi:hypothetical protein
MPMSKAWTEAELFRRGVVEAGRSAVASMRKGQDEALIAWAQSAGLAVRIDRRTAWGNPFVIGTHGDRDQVIARYRDRLAERPDLLARLPELRGRVLVCWCYPDRCHGDVLCEAVEARG